MELVHFLLLLIDVFLDLDASLLILGGVIQDFLFLLVVLLQLFILGTEVLVDIDQVVDLLVQHIDIGEEVVVLFFSLDEGVLNFEDVGQSGGLLDGREGLVDHLHVSLVVVDQFDLLLVVDDQLGQSVLQHCGSIILDGIDLPCLDATASVQLGIF